MGRAARWLRGLLGGRKSDSSAGTTPEASRQPSEKKRWGFGKSFREKEKTAQQKQPTRAAAAARAAEDRKVSYREAADQEEESKRAIAVAAADQEEESKRAIAVAAATAAVAEAAVAAAHAAAAVVRLTSSGRCVGFGKREEWAAVKIQSTFRGYLARRALKALRGLVKLQALVRGNIVRKQAAETLRCMQALVRVQARARACRAIRSERVRPEKPSRSHPGPPTPEKYEHSIRTNGSKSDRSGSLVRNSSKSAGADANDRERSHSSGWNWLDRWIEERYWNNQEATSAAIDDDKSAKILEVDPGKPQFNSKRRSNHNNNHNHIQSSCSNSRSFATVPDSPSKDSTTAQLSIRSPSTVDMRQSLSPLMFPAESPQYYSATSRPGSSSRRGPFTPSKSECSRSLFAFSDYPSYMANTESSRAKVRSQSAPKQRPPLEYEKSGSVKRLSVAPAQKSNTLHVKFTNKAYPGSGRLDRLGMPVRY